MYFLQLYSAKFKVSAHLEIFRGRIANIEFALKYSLKKKVAWEVYKTLLAKC